MKVVPTAIRDVLLITPRVFEDERGFFMETWQERRFADSGIDYRFVQDNHSHSIRGTLRGLHYQLPNTQGKLVRAVRGEIFDVAVDLRKSSPTFGQWVGEYLSGRNKRQLWIPPGFAHGFLVVSESADCLYKCTDFYAPESERTVIWNDDDLGIEWPVPADGAPIVSNKDLAGVAFRSAEYFQ